MATFIKTLRAVAPQGSAVNARVMVRGNGAPVFGPIAMAVELTAQGWSGFATDCNWDPDWDNPAVYFDSPGNLWPGNELLLANLLRANGVALSPAVVGVGGAVVVVVNNVQVGTLTLIRGDSYLNVDGNALRRKKASGAPWPADLTNWSLTFTARKVIDVTATGSAVITAAGAIVTAAGDNQEVRFDLASVDTTALAVCTNGYEYDVQAFKGPSSRITLEIGTMSVKADQTLT